MMPKVSFVVPCYGLAHLLPECVNSILTQTYTSLEVIIMDDCSPDDTEAVAETYSDPRIIYVRNEQNLGHLRNYNKGISIAQGKYVWLISADDFLRRPYIVERYVDLLEKHPNVGFVFCPAVGFLDGRETEVQKYSMRGDKDTIFQGHEFLCKQLLNSDCVVVASALARKDCYTKVSFYPLDMPYAGDWYIWSIFALYYDVGYLCEPMVCYRDHGLSMTNSLKQRNALILIQDDLTVLWRIRKKASELGLQSIVESCDDFLVDRYVLCITREVHDLGSFRLPLEECLDSVKRNAVDSHHEVELLAHIYAGLADELYWKGEHTRALEFYGRSLGVNPNDTSIRIKISLLKAGRLGVWARGGLLTLRRVLSRRIKHVGTQV